MRPRRGQNDCRRQAWRRWRPRRHRRRPRRRGPRLVSVVCGLGAGDVLGGAFVHGLLAGWPPARIVEYANAAGAIVAGRLMRRRHDHRNGYRRDAADRSGRDPLRRRRLRRLDHDACRGPRAGLPRCSPTGRGGSTSSPTGRCSSSPPTTRRGMIGVPWPAAAMADRRRMLERCSSPSPTRGSTACWRAPTSSRTSSVSAPSTARSPSAR